MMRGKSLLGSFHQLPTAVLGSTYFIKIPFGPFFLHHSPYSIAIHDSEIRPWFQQYLIHFSVREDDLSIAIHV